VARPPWRVRDRETFERLRRSRVRARRGPVSVTWAPPASSEAAGGAPRVAFAVARRVGTAVVRNRLRRRIRAILADAGLAPGAYLVSVRPEAAALPPSEFRSALGGALAALPVDGPAAEGRRP
jgi:ribonuclease P protein component